jgi:hypothetical protein
MYMHVSGFIECCGCRLAPKIESIFTHGLGKDDVRTGLFGEIKSCERCEGKGCDACMMPGFFEFNTRSKAIAHLEEHRKAGHRVYQEAIDRLIEEMEKYGNKVR